MGSKNHRESGHFLAQQPGYVKQDTSRVFTSIVRDIEQKAATLPDLSQRYKEKILNSALALLLAQKPELAVKALGAPGSAHELMIDECLGHQLVVPVYQHFGRCNAARMIFPAATKDMGFFAALTERRVSAVITCDAARSGPKDLCYIANAAYRTGDENLPGVIVVPQDHGRAKNLLLANKGRVFDYLAQPRAQVLDLA